MRKFLLCLIFVFLLPAVLGALPEGTYGSGLYGKGLHGVQSSAKATFTTDVEIPQNVITSIDANQSNTTLELVTDSPYSGFVTIIRYDSAPSGTGSSPASPLNKYISISTEPIDLNYSVIRVQYSDAEVSSANIQEDSLRLYKWNGSNWLLFDGINGGVDIFNNFVFANTTSFSVWGIFGSSVPSPSPAPSPAPSGGGGGGGSSGFSADFSKSVTMTLNLIKGQKYNLNINGELHKYSITNIDVENQQAEFVFESERKVLLLNLNQPEFLNYDNDDYDDFEITLTKIYGENLAIVQIKSIHLFIPQAGGGAVSEPESIEVVTEEIQPEVETEQEVEVTPEVPETEKGKQKSIIIVWILGFALLLVIAYGLYAYYKSKEKIVEEEKDEQQKGNKRENQH